MGTIVLSGITMEVCECINCGIPFTVPLNVIENQRRDGGFHYCPNGHRQGWSQSNAERAREERERNAVRQERDRLRQQLAQKDDEIREAERRAAAARGQATRLRNRAKAGLCPCCNRHFTNLERHMATKHADEKADA